MTKNLNVRGNAVLVYVFELSGRGIVLALENWEGRAVSGDSLIVGDFNYEITGIEIIKYKNVAAHEKARSKGIIGISISSGSKDSLQGFKGLTVCVQPNGVDYH